MEQDRRLRVSADNLHSLGSALGKAYGPAIDAGLARVEDYFLTREPETLSHDAWLLYAARLRSACKKHCPATFDFAEGLSEALGRDAFLGLLDFELYTLEMERDAKEREEGGGSEDISSSDGESSEESKLPGHCSGVAVTGGKNAVLAQTVDLPLELYGWGDCDAVLELSLTSGLTVMCYDCDGRLCPIGLNSVGLAITLFNLHLRQQHGFERDSIRSYSHVKCLADVFVSVQALAWEVLLSGRGITDTIAWLQQQPALPMMCGSSIILASNGNLDSYCFELSADDVTAVPMDTGVGPFCRTNHPMTDHNRVHFEGTCPSEEKDSKKRLRELKKETIALKPGMDELGQLMLASFQRNKHVRHKQSIAVVVADVVHGQLIVEFKQRVAMKDGEKVRVTTGKKLSSSKYGIQRTVHKFHVKMVEGKAIEDSGVSPKANDEHQFCNCVIL